MSTIAIPDLALVVLIGLALSATFFWRTFAG